MGIEIERKFLVADESWRQSITHSEHLSDGLVAWMPERKVRVRLGDGRATLAIKAKQGGIRDAEFEYPIPVADARELLDRHCIGEVLSKTRYSVPHAGLTWQVDVYEGLLDGVVLAEIELASETQALSLPPWIGREVTGLLEYRKIEMVRRAQAKRGAQNTAA